MCRAETMTSNQKSNKQCDPRSKPPSVLHAPLAHQTLAPPSGKGKASSQTRDTHICTYMRAQTLTRHPRPNRTDNKFPEPGPISSATYRTVRCSGTALDGTAEKKQETLNYAAESRQRRDTPPTTHPPPHPAHPPSNHGAGPTSEGSSCPGKMRPRYPRRASKHHSLPRWGVHAA